MSPVGNSDVPYPIAFSKNNVYFMLDLVWVNKKHLITEATVFNSEKLYGEFYGHINKDNNKNIVKNKQKLKNIKLVHDRHFTQELKN